MGQTTVSNSKFAGEGSISREEAFKRFLAKDISPRDIIELAKKPIESPSSLGVPIKYKPSEKAATMSAERPSLGREFEEGEASHDLERNRAILRNPRATAEDKRIAQSRIAEVSRLAKIQ
jgi:hypothetical protein